jgi:hypothetical protein
MSMCNVRDPEAVERDIETTEARLKALRAEHRYCVLRREADKTAGHKLGEAQEARRGQ